ncbi:MAG: putative sulfate exporter family transporter [Acidobacteriota bacterium]
MADDSQASTTQLWPGVLLTLALAVSARGLHALLPGDLGRALGAVLVAVALGLLLSNLIALPARFGPGIRFCYETLLRTAIVLLGAGLSFQSAAKIGGRSLLTIMLLMTLALIVAHLLGRIVGVPPKLATLIGVGTSVCGNTAISAVSPVIGASDEETAFAITTNTLFGMLAVFAYPLIGHWLAMSDLTFGMWCGTAVNDTSQVVATSAAFSAAATQTATVIKLTRNALMGPLIVIIGFWAARRRSGAAQRSIGERLKQSVPPFVLGFLAMAALNSLGLFASLSAALGFDTGNALKECASFLIVLALAGVGLGTRFSAMKRIGFAPLWVGLATALTVSLTSLALHW